MHDKYTGSLNIRAVMVLATKYYIYIRIFIS